MGHRFTLSWSLWRDKGAYKRIMSSPPRKRFNDIVHNACQWETFSTQCSWETHFPDLCNHNNVQNEVTRLDVCGRGMCTRPCNQMSMPVYGAHLYTHMWKPENNVLSSSSLVLDFTLYFVFWDKLSGRTCSYSIQLHCLWGPVQYGGYPHAVCYI